VESKSIGAPGVAVAAAPEVGVGTAVDKLFCGVLIAIVPFDEVV
jgi:hypothetical protein